MNSSTATTPNDFADVLADLGGAWGWVLGFGIVSIVAGIIAFFFTGATLVAIAILFGLQLVFAGIFRFMATFAIPGHHAWLRALTGLLAVVSLAVGVYLVAHPLLSLLVLAFVLGIFWVVSGVVELFVAIENHDTPGRGWVAASGVLGIIAGLVVTFYPGISLVALTIVLGVWLVIFGVIEVMAAFRLRSLGRGLPIGDRTRAVPTRA
jgi:uncharacterized membrane protein HdeD (DUF308 family)